MVDVKNIDELRAWFNKQPHKTVTLIAVRAALRVTPYLGGMEPTEKAIRRTLPSFWALASALSTACSTSSDDILNAAAAAAAAYDAYDAANAAAYAAAAAAAAAHAAAHAAAAAAAHAAADASSSKYVQKDIDYLLAGGDPRLLQKHPLWHENGMPADLQRRWAQLRDALLKNDKNWSVWTDWYAALIAGNAPFIEAIEVGDPKNSHYGRCTFPEDYYQDPPRLNAALRAVIDGYWARQNLLSYQPAGGPPTDSDDETIFLKAQNNTPDPDLRAAEGPQTQQLFDEVLRKAQSLQRVCNGIGDNRGWFELEDATNRYLTNLGESCADASTRILILHSQTIELASFIEEDRMRIRTPMANQGQLPPDARRALSSFIMTAAPWVRRFPSALKQDEEIDNFLAQPALYRPSKDILAAAGATALISDDDRALLSNLLEALQRTDGLSQKAGKSGQFGVRNVVITGMQVLASFYGGAVGSAVATDSIVAQKIAAVITQRESEVLQIMQDAPEDIREATIEIIRQTKERRETPQRPDRPIYLEKRENED